MLKIVVIVVIIVVVVVVEAWLVGGGVIGVGIASCIFTISTNHNNIQAI